MLDPGNMLGHAAQAFSKIKLGKGVIGKVCSVFLGFLAFLSIASICIWQNQFAILFIVIVGAAIFLIFLYFIHKFCKDHPDLALLEGAEFIRISQMRLAAKEKSQIPFAVPVPDPKSTRLPNQPAVILLPQASDDQPDDEQ